MNQHAENTTTPPPANVLCVTCGYDLRGQSRAAKCPECATAVVLSLTQYDLASAEPKWLFRIALGMSLAAWGLTIFFVSTIVVTLLFLTAEQWRWWHHKIGNKADQLFIALVIVSAISLFGFLIGCWVATQQEPRMAGRERLFNTRRTIRLGLVLIISCAVCWFVILFKMYKARWEELILLAMASLSAVAILTIAGLGWVKTLAVRMPGSDVKDQATIQFRFFRWALPALFLCILIAISLNSFGVLVCAVLIAAIYILLLLIVHVLFIPTLLFALRKNLWACHEYARASHLRNAH